jgi:hypothetical protein
MHLYRHYAHRNTFHIPNLVVTILRSQFVCAWLGLNWKILSPRRFDGLLLKSYPLRISTIVQSRTPHLDLHQNLK